MKRQIALDTETTGKDADGSPGDHRIIEIGCVEIIDRRITGNTLQLYINPERPVDEEAVQVHGLTDEFLKDKPVFAKVAPKILDFIKGAELLIHNARFDTSFLDKEWLLLNMKERTADMCTIVDTVALARKINPNNLVNLDNLCNLYDIDNSRRTQHGALLDARILAEVYLAMTGGQSSFNFGEQDLVTGGSHWERPEGAKLPMMQVDDSSRVRHVLETIKLAQNVKLKKTEDGTVIAGSLWGSEYDMPFLEQGSDEDKKAFYARKKAQQDLMLEKLLTPEDRKLLEQCLNADKEAQEKWEFRVQHGIKE